MTFLLMSEKRWMSDSDVAEMKILYTQTDVDRELHSVLTSMCPEIWRDRAASISNATQQRHS